MTHRVRARFLATENNIEVFLFQFKPQYKNNHQQQTFKDIEGTVWWMSDTEGALKWVKLFHNSVLQVLFLGVLQSCLHMKRRVRETSTNIHKT